MTTPRRIRRNTTLFWGTGLACLLVLQSLVTAGAFWFQVGKQQRQQIDSELREQCMTLTRLAPPTRPSWIADMLGADVHRRKFLAMFDAEGRVLAGNLKELPELSPGTKGSQIVKVQPTNLRGINIDIARAMRCAMSDGTSVIAGMDLDQFNSTLQSAEHAVMFALPVAFLLAILVGIVVATQAGRRLDAVRILSEKIVAGELDRRLPVGSRPDSFQMLCGHINTMLDRIEALMQEVRGVGDDIAHELRTPLTRLRATVERQMITAQSKEDFVQAADSVLKGIIQADGLVSALLRIREIEYHRKLFSFQDVALQKLAADVVELYQPVAENVGMQLRLSAEHTCRVRGDPDLLMEALSNLVDNALKFGPVGSAIDVTLEIQENQCPRLSVTDRGDPIVADDLAHVFKRFYRGRKTLQQPGSGLGLSLVKAIADLHDIEVFFETLDNAGGKRAVLQFIGTCL